jgi:AGCS family alanine or glycine:cation symporter
LAIPACFGKIDHKNCLGEVEMEWLETISGNLNQLVWGIPMLALLLGTGIFLSIRLHFLQFAKFGTIMRHTIGRLFSNPKDAREGTLSPLQALSTALAGTVGTGNIAGVAGAIAIGGPGAIFWMWIAALFGMCTKYAEIVLAVHYRKKNDKGEYVGGPMYYITNGLGKNWKWLAVIFCIFGALAAIGTGNMTQINTIASSIGQVVTSLAPDTSASDIRFLNGIIGFAGAFITVLVLFGGMKRIGSVTEKLVPMMAVIYIVTCLIVILTHADRIGGVFGSILNGAFHPAAISGGLAGVTIREAAKAGFGRGIFSNEAGLGTAPIAHAAADVRHPVEQGMYGVFEVFADTIIICSMTAFAILCTGAAGPVYGQSAGAELTISAFGATFGDQLAAVIIAVCITMFAFSTLLGWSLYGARCTEFLFGTKAIPVYQAVYVIFAAIGANIRLDRVWEIADTMNGLMAIPNLIALWALSGQVVKLTKDYFKKK